MPRKTKKQNTVDDADEDETFNPYHVLGLTESCSGEQIKKAYRVLALRFHPDRASNHGQEEATRKFQELSRAYSIIGDPVRRQTYDRTGQVEGSPDSAEWFDYWRLLFPKISFKDIEDFERKYKNSEEEWEDLKEAYLKSKGDMDEIMELVILAEPADEDRFREKLRAAIDEGELENFQAFTKEPPSKRRRRARKALSEAKEAEVAAVELGILGKTDQEFKELIAARSRNNFESMISGLEAKYSGTGSNKKQKSSKKK